MDMTQLDRVHPLELRSVASPVALRKTNISHARVRLYTHSFLRCHFLYLKKHRHIATYLRRKLSRRLPRPYKRMFSTR